MADVVRVSVDDIERAAELIEGVAVRTPMEESRWLSALTGSPVLPQVREPPAHRVVQGPRRLHPDVAPLRGGAGARRGRRVGRQPCAGCRPGRAVPRHQGDGVHARGRADPQGEGHPGVRRGRRLPRPLPRGRAGRGPGVPGADRRRADPPLRQHRDRRRPGDRRAGDRRAGARRRDGRRAVRRRRAAGRDRDRGQGEAAGRHRDRRPGRGRRGVPRLAEGRPPGGAHAR